MMPKFKVKSPIKYKGRILQIDTIHDLEEALIQLAIKKGRVELVPDERRQKPEKPEVAKPPEKPTAA
jgi:hypothetical protein